MTQRLSHGRRRPKTSRKSGSSSRRIPAASELRNRLVEHYLPLVKYNGERIWSRLPDGVELDDLISAGVFGLMDAINAFDMGRGVKFETYCVPRIRGAMLDELRTHGLGAAARPLQGQQAQRRPQDARSRARPLAQRERARRRTWA